MSAESRSLDDRVLEHLRRTIDAPDVAGTKYELRRELGRGGMGTVYAAWDRELQRPVALKVITVPEAMPDGIARVRQEARTLAALEHPGIVPVHDLGELPDGRVFYVMKLVRGTPLDVAAANRPRAELLRIFRRVCDAVAFAHAHGVVHRDLKPANIMVGEFGEVLVVDWGLARISSHDASTERRVAEGTPGFMAPEQARGDDASSDPRVDVFALGALLRWLLDSGSDPVPRPLSAIACRASAAEREARYASVEQLAADVDAWLGRGRVSAYAEPLWERVGRVVVKYRTPILLVAAYLVMRALLLAAMRR